MSGAAERPDRVNRRQPRGETIVSSRKRLLTIQSRERAISPPTDFHGRGEAARHIAYLSNRLRALLFLPFTPAERCDTLTAVIGVLPAIGPDAEKYPST